MRIDSTIKERIQLFYPGLAFEDVDEKLILEGVFRFKASFNKDTNQYTIDPMIDDSNTIIDEYQIRIDIPNDGNLPIVYEIGGRIPPGSDFHKNINGGLCLAPPFDLINDFTLDIFLDTLVLQFLYDQSFRERFGIWPRGEYSHGTLGVIENYYDRLGSIPNLDEYCLHILSKDPDFKKYRDILMSRNRIRGHHTCICGSGKQYRKCHDRVFKGLWNLQTFVRDKDE